MASKYQLTRKSEYILLISFLLLQNMHGKSLLPHNNVQQSNYLLTDIGDPLCFSWLRHDIDSLQTLSLWCGIRADGENCGLSLSTAMYDGEEVLYLGGNCWSGLIGTEGFWRIYSYYGEILEDCESYAYSFGCSIGGEAKYVLEDIELIWDCTIPLPECSTCNLSKNDLLCLDWVRSSMKKYVNFGFCEGLEGYLCDVKVGAGDYAGREVVVVKAICGEDTEDEWADYFVYDCTGLLINKCYYDPYNTSCEYGDTKLLEEINNLAYLWDCSMPFPGCPVCDYNESEFMCMDWVRDTIINYYPYGQYCVSDDFFSLISLDLIEYSGEPILSIGGCAGYDACWERLYSCYGELLGTCFDGIFGLTCSDEKFENIIDRKYIRTLWKCSDPDPACWGCLPFWPKSKCSNLDVQSVIISGDAEINLDGYIFEEGDIIGLFYKDEFGLLVCADYGAYYPGTNLQLIACKDDPNTARKDGFEKGEKYIFKFWNCSINIDYEDSMSVYVPIGSSGFGIPDATDTYGDGTISIVQAFGSATSSRENLIEDYSGILLFPNPSIGDLTIQADFPIQEVYAIDLLGRKISATNTHQLHFDHPGIYLVHIFNGQRWYVEKVIVE